MRDGDEFHWGGGCRDQADPAEPWHALPPRSPAHPYLSETAALCGVLPKETGLEPGDRCWDVFGNWFGAYRPWWPPGLPGHDPCPECRAVIDGLARYAC